jgi:hypothetical protein
MARPLQRREGFFVRRYGVTLPGRRIKRPEIGELLRVGKRPMSQ